MAAVLPTYWRASRYEVTLRVKMIQLRPDAIKKWRAEMTQAELAKKAGVSRHTVMRLEAGEGADAVTFETINRIARALDVDADALVTFDR